MRTYIFYLLLLPIFFTACQDNVKHSEVKKEFSVSLRGATDNIIPINAAIILEFSHRVNTTTLYPQYNPTTQTTFYGVVLYKIVNDERILEDTLKIDTLSAQKFRVYKNLNFDPDSNYEMELQEHVAALDGRSLGQKIVFAFSTLDQSDYTAPIITLTTPEYSSYSQSAVSIIFNEPIVPLEGKEYFKLSLEGADEIEIPCSKVEYGQRSITCFPADYLMDLESYNIFIKENISDLSGNFTDFNFSTVIGSFYNSPNLAEQEVVMIDSIQNEYLSTFDANATALFYPDLLTTSDNVAYGLTRVGIMRSDDGSIVVEGNEGFLELISFESESDMNETALDDYLITKIVKSDSYLYLGTKGFGFYVIDASSFEILGHHVLASTVTDIEMMRDGNLFVATLDDGLYHFEFNAPSTLSLKEQYSDLAPIYALSDFNDTLFMARGYEGVSTFELNTLSAISLKKSRAFVHDVFAFNDIVYGTDVLVIADAQAGVYTSDLNMENNTSYNVLHYAYGLEPVVDDVGVFNFGIIDVKKGITIMDSHLQPMGYISMQNFSVVDSSLLSARHPNDSNLTFMLNDEHELLIIQDMQNGGA